MDTHELAFSSAAPEAAFTQFGPMNSLEYNHTVYLKKKSDNRFSSCKIVLCCMCPCLISYLNHQQRIKSQDNIVFIFILSIYKHLVLFSTGSLVALYFTVY